MTNNTTALNHLQTDAVLAQIIAVTPHPQVAYAHEDDVYMALLESIVSQQISVKAADAIFARFRALFTENYPHPEQLLEKTTDELRSAGLSGQKINYLKSVAEFALSHPLDRTYLDSLTDEEVIAYLIPIKGVGRWTVEMLLMFVLDRPDVLPVDDLVIRQKMQKAFPGQTDGLTGKTLLKQLIQLAEPWRPYRTLACRYLWRWKPADGV